jgi:hypothetical protein
MLVLHKYLFGHVVPGTTAAPGRTDRPRMASLSHPTRTFPDIRSHPPNPGAPMPPRFLAGTLVALTALLFAPHPSQAQSTVTETRIGGASWYSGTLGGEQVSGSSQRIGSFEYTNLSVGRTQLSGTHQQLGSMRYSSWSDGSTATTTRLGGFDYTTTSHGTSYTGQTLGSTRYVTGSDGSSATTTRIGSFEYTTITPAPAPRAPRPLSIVPRRHDPRIP